MDPLAVLAQALSPTERKLLPFLESSTTDEELVSQSEFPDAEVKRGLMWLENHDIIETKVVLAPVRIDLNERGNKAKQEGFAEKKIMDLVAQSPDGVALTKLFSLGGKEIGAAVGYLKKNNFITMGEDKTVLPGESFAQFTTSFPLPKILETHDFPCKKEELSAEVLSRIEENISQSASSLFTELKQKKIVTFSLTEQGKALLAADIDFSSVEEQLTDTMLKDGSWKEKTFRTYDVESGVPEISGGRRHPYREAANLLRDVYLAMGFQEMSGPWVETAFWCMDAMWIPQDHPARDEQDTFYVGQSGDLPEHLLARVQEVHEHGGDSGSRGHGSPWNKAIASQLILRTHSTAATFRFFGQGVQANGKYFYIANVFRNEAVDATHLAEFLQAEGFVIGDDLTLADLMGFIKEFYARLGIHKIRFKPTYNPYTEPSLEAHYYDELKGKWYALINSGIFRPESLYPFNMDKTVIAWGMGASRVASLLNHKTNLRDLVGPQVDLHWIAKHITPQANLEN